MLVNDPLGSLGRCLGIESAFRINDNDRAECAKSKAACLNDKNICKSFRFDLFLERVANFVASGGSTSGTAADKDLLAISCVLSHFFRLGCYQSADHDQLSVHELFICHCHGLHLLVVGINNLNCGFRCAFAVNFAVDSHDGRKSASAKTAAAVN